MTFLIEWLGVAGTVIVLVTLVWALCFALWRAHQQAVQSAYEKGWNEAWSEAQRFFGPPLRKVFGVIERNANTIGIQVRRYYRSNDHDER